LILLSRSFLQAFIIILHYTRYNYSKGVSELGGQKRLDKN